MFKTKWYEESPGIISSKRLFGGIALSAGLVMKVIIFIAAMIYPIPDAATASAQADSFLMAGTALLGITGLDVFKRGA